MHSWRIVWSPFVVLALLVGTQSALGTTRFFCEIEFLSREVGFHLRERIDQMVLRDRATFDIELLSNGFVRVERYNREGSRVQIVERLHLSRALQVAALGRENRFEQSTLNRTENEFLPGFLDVTVPGRLTQWLESGGRVRISPRQDTVEVAFYRGAGVPRVRTVTDSTPAWLRSLIRRSHTQEDLARSQSPVLRPISREGMRRSGRGTGWTEALSEIIGAEAYALRRYRVSRALTSEVRRLAEEYTRNWIRESLLGDRVDQMMEILYSPEDVLSLRQIQSELESLNQRLSSYGKEVDRERPLDQWLYTRDGFRLMRQRDESSRRETVVIVDQSGYFVWSLHSEIQPRTGIRTYSHLGTDSDLRQLEFALESVRHLL